MEELKLFIKCYNEQYSFKKTNLRFQKIPIKFDLQKKQSESNLFEREEAFLDLFRKVIDEKFEYEKFYFYQKKISRHNHILARLVESFIFIKQSNMSRAKKILLDITKHDLSYHIFKGERPRFTIEKQIDLSREILKELGLYFEGQNEFKNLIYYLYAHTSGRFQAMIKEEFELSLKLSKIREYYSSYSFGKPYPFLWGPLVFENSSLAEYIKALDLNDAKTLPTSKESLLFYREIDAIPRHAKKTILTLFRELQSSKDLYDQFLEISLWENEKFFGFLNANEVNFRKILAATKRDYFKELLDKKKHQSFAIFQLISLGDWNSSYILELAQHENDKL